ncbi:MAG TPA: UDP-N-acetylglucosamine 2-epimerase (non-hydrolyzing) [Gemmatimonadales bacterium]|nr:UDP-N-acetylglucosamine 2-epimerase (non-hydrolyzing) [Gemmatimonadales bacterium]
MTLAPVALFFGTRPQVIKASVLREALAQIGPVLAVDSGQHYDYEMHRVHYDQLGVRPPDAFLGVGPGSHAEQTAAMLTVCEQWLAAHPVRLAVVIGDTNTTLACALAAVKHRIRVAHVEAGLRAADALMAEEINRRVVDAVAHWLCAPCGRVEVVLRREHPAAVVAATGDVAYDVLRRSLPRVPRIAAIPGLEPAWAREFVYCTLHRAELVDSPDRLREVIDALARVPQPVLFAAHPRTTAALERSGTTLGPNVHRITPVGYLESLALVQRASVVVTDSGGLQREAYWLGRPCVTVRGETEWLETIDCGANRLVPPEMASRLPEAISAAHAAPANWPVGAYGDGDAATRVATMLAHA